MRAMLKARLGDGGEVIRDGSAKTRV